MHFTTAQDNSFTATSSLATSCYAASPTTSTASRYAVRVLAGVCLLGRLVRVKTSLAIRFDMRTLPLATSLFRVLCRPCRFHFHYCMHILMTRLAFLPSPLSPFISSRSSLPPSLPVTPSPPLFCFCFSLPLSLPVPARCHSMLPCVNLSSSISAWRAIFRRRIKLRQLGKTNKHTFQGGAGRKGAEGRKRHWRRGRWRRVEGVT